MTCLVLFDIDGTLLRSSGIGRAATREALKRVYGTYGNLSEFYPGGRTIEAILFDTMENAHIKPEYIYAGRRLFYAEFIAAFTDILSLDIANGSYSFPDDEIRSSAFYMFGLIGGVDSRQNTFDQSL